MGKTNATQAISNEQLGKLEELATLLNVPKSRVLDALLSTDVTLLANAVLMPEEARRRLSTVETLQIGRDVAEAVVRYLETKDSVLNSSTRTKSWSTLKDDLDDSI